MGGQWDLDSLGRLVPSLELRLWRDCVSPVHTRRGGGAVEDPCIWPHSCDPSPAHVASPPGLSQVL